MRSATTPPWHLSGAGLQPTPAEWREWFLANDEEGQIEIAEWSIRFAEEANYCLMCHGGRR